ncbi:hypothetical protein BDV97DRAFT_370508 [Delphinella strobiligena]|nr:hypothetical protein BDV97DRAFT_370508 [Delphinella strobiligena]
MAAFHPSYNQYAAYDPARRTPQQAQFDRNLLYARSDPTYRAATLPTPIHNIENENSSARKRTQLACGRCRKRKIKCSGNPAPAIGCLACRSAGADLSQCTFERVGTTHRYNVDVSSQPPTPKISYGTVGFITGLAIDEGSRPISYSQPQPTSPPYDRLDHYTFDLPNTPTATLLERQFVDDRSWRPSTSINGYPSLSPVVSLDLPYRAADNLAPLNIQSVPPPPIERRLPAPNFVGTPMSPESIASPTAGVSGRLANLSISGGQAQSRDDNHSTTRSRNSIHDLTNASVMLPPMSRGNADYEAIAPTPHSTTSTQGYVLPSTSTEGLYAARTASGSLPASHATVLPQVHVPSNAPHYQQSSSAPYIPAIMTTEDHSVSRYNQPADNAPSLYGWTTANDNTYSRNSALMIGEEDQASQCYQGLALAGKPRTDKRNAVRPETDRRSSTQHCQSNIPRAQNQGQDSTQR